MHSSNKLHLTASWGNVLRSGAFRMLMPATLLLLAACEAPLNLELVEAENNKPIARYDMFQAAAHHGERVAVVSSIGAVILSDDGGATWQRHDFEGRPSLIDITSCDNGDLFALDSQKRVWGLAAGGSNWTESLIDTQESTLSIHCAPGGRLWVTASFGTLYWKDLQAEEWQEFTLMEDLQFTNVRFMDEMKGLAVGEFGTVITTTDGGDNWEMLEPIPNDFYPMGSDFLDEQNGWVGGLDGVIWHTSDGGATWQRQETLSASPIYNILADERGVFAVGGSAKLMQLVDGQWRRLEGAPAVLAFIRGLDILDNGSLLVAGGGGTLAVIPSPGSGF